MQKADGLKCKKCKGKMRRGVAIKDYLIDGIPDFTNSEVVTLSYDGPGKTIHVLKCKACGWSISL